MKMSVRAIGLASLAKMGCLLGIVAAFLPSLLCGILATAAACQLSSHPRSMAAAAIRFDLPLIGEQVLSLNLVRMLRLENLLSFLDTVTAASFVTLALVVLALALVSGLFVAVIVTLVGLAYNFVASTTGGLVVEMKPLAGQERRPERESSEPRSGG